MQGVLFGFMVNHECLGSYFDRKGGGDVGKFPTVVLNFTSYSFIDVRCCTHPPAMVIVIEL